MHELPLETRLPLDAGNAGYFMSRGVGEHPDRVIETYELIFVTRNTLSMIEGNRIFHVGENESLILWPHRRHKGAAPFGSDVRFYWLHFTLKESAGQALAVPQHIKVKRPDHLTSLFRRFLDDQEGHALSPFAANLQVMLMLSEVADSSHADAEGDESDATLANRVSATIRTHYHEKLTTSSIAGALHRNPDYLGRVFREVTGHTITEAIHQYRLKQARRLLLESQLTVEDIAMSCGYNDTGYFRRVFKRAEGIPPRRFKRLHAKLHVNTG